MKKSILIISIIVLSSSPLFAQTQTEMNQSSYNEFQKTEKLREQTISRIRLFYSDKPEFLLALSESEKSWAKYRDAFLSMMFPGENKQELYGSVYPMVYSHQKTRLTQLHIKELQIWLNGIDEGDIGWGSVMIKQTIKEKANQSMDPTRTTPVDEAKP